MQQLRNGASRPFERRAERNFQPKSGCSWLVRLWWGSEALGPSKNTQNGANIGADPLGLLGCSWRPFRWRRSFGFGLDGASEVGGWAATFSRLGLEGWSPSMVGWGWSPQWSWAVGGVRCVGSVGLVCWGWAVGQGGLGSWVEGLVSFGLAVH